MSTVTLQRAIASRFLRGDLRLAWFAIGDNSGWVGAPSIAAWVNCSEEEAQDIICELADMGLLIRLENGDLFAPHLSETGMAPPSASPSRSNRAPIPPSVRAAVFARDGQVCRYCGTENGPFHLDHAIPLSRGGETAAANLVVACVPCNLSKGARTPEEWKVNA